jgi:hypothetical protein
MDGGQGGVVGFHTVHCCQVFQDFAAILPKKICTVKKHPTNFTNAIHFFTKYKPLNILPKIRVALWFSVRISLFSFKNLFSANCYFAHLLLYCSLTRAIVKKFSLSLSNKEWSRAKRDSEQISLFALCRE